MSTYAAGAPLPVPATVKIAGATASISILSVPTVVPLEVVVTVAGPPDASPEGITQFN